MFKRRDGTAGVSGHLYETKLLSLLYFRAFHDDTIEEFQLASNVDKIGAFDDICFRARVKKQDNPICLFIQAKHRENRKQTLKIDLSTYFISYLKIQQHFDPSNEDLFFGCKFDETDCYFVIYTTARDEFSNESKVKSSLCSNLHDLIDTGGTVNPYNLRDDTKSLCEIAIKEHMASLAELIAKYIRSPARYFTVVRKYFPPPKEPPDATSSVSMYTKRAGTSGIRGQQYETKLLSLLYFRAVHDDTIQKFQLAMNMDKIGALSDICIKAEVKGNDKPVTMFIRVEHRENKKQVLKIDLATHFDSYMKIRQNFSRNPRCHWVFESTYTETECLFVIFTNANVDYSHAAATSGLSTILNDILDVGGIVKQPNSDENIEYLTKKTVKDQIISLAEWIVGFIYGDKNFQLMLSDELVLRYHVILAREVVDVSDIQPLESKDAPRYRIASFRDDFFDNNEEYITLFRDTLYLEVIKRRQMNPAEILLCLSEFLGDPTDATRLSKFIGTVVTYNNGQLEFDKQSIEAFRPNMKPMDISRSTVNKAVELAAIEILSTVKFKVPAAFGNKDLTLRGSDDKIEKRICHLTNKIINLLVECKPSKVVTIDESLEDGFLRLNGGLAGAIGNIFVLDDDTKLIKITDNCETLGTHAKSLYTKLKSEVHDLHEYKFCLKVDKLPKLSFDCSHYEEKMARDFLNKILVYCNQAEENELQETLKNEIEEIQRNQPNYFQAKTDAILMRYYDEIQKWLMQPQHALYLSPRINVFRQLVDDIIKDPLMSSINLSYTSKIKKHDFTFTEDAVRSLNLQDLHSSTIVISENCVLTVIKVLQHLKNKGHVVLDVEYIASLPKNDLNALRAELMNTNKEKVLILVCDKIDSKNEMKTLKNIAEAVKNKTNIIISDPKSLEILIIHKYFPEADQILHDKKFSLFDVCKESQKSIFVSATVVFPGVEIRLDHLVKDWPKTGLTSAGEANAAGVAAITDQPTATGSRDFGIEHCGVEELKKEFPIDLESLSSPPREAEELCMRCMASSSKDIRDAISTSMNKNAMYYDMSGEKYLIILNQHIFKNQPATKVGNDYDVNSLTEVFGNLLGFHRIVFADFEYKQIIEQLTEIATRDHSKTSCICITILTYGDKAGEVHAADRPYPLTDVIAIFDKQRSLVNTPKLLLVQACRGANMDAGNTVFLDKDSDSVFTIPSHAADVLVMCSPSEEPISYRNIKYGTRMIQTLCYVIQNNYEDLDLMNMIMITNRMVIAENPSHEAKDFSKPMYTTYSTLTKRLKF